MDVPPSLPLIRNTSRVQVQAASQPPRGVNWFSVLSLFPILAMLSAVSLNWPVLLLQPKSLLLAATACILGFQSSGESSLCSPPRAAKSLDFPSSITTPDTLIFECLSQVVTGSSHNDHTCFECDSLMHICLGSSDCLQPPCIACCSPHASPAAVLLHRHAVLNSTGSSFANPGLFISSVFLNVDILLQAVGAIDS